MYNDAALVGTNSILKLHSTIQLSLATAFKIYILVISHISGPEESKS